MDREAFKNRFIFYIVVLGSTLMMGVFFVYSSLFAMEDLEGLDPESKIITYIAALVIGMAGGLIAFYFGNSIIRGKYYLIQAVFIFHIFFLFLPHMYSSIANVNRWVYIAGFQVQPSEFSKIILPAFITYLFYRIKNPFILYTAIFFSIGSTVSMIFIQPDLSSSAIVLMIGIFTVFLNLKNKKSFIIFFIVVLILFLGLFLFRDEYLADYQLNRVSGEDTFQTDQSRRAISNGGIIGTAPFGGNIKYNVPASYADFIMSIIGEEWGKLGVMLVLTMFFLLSREMTRLSYFTRDAVTFSFSTAIAFYIFLQMSINALVGLGVRGIPVTGVTLPLMSYGNSSLIITLTGIGWTIGLIYFNGMERLNNEGE